MLTKSQYSYQECKTMVLSTKPKMAPQKRHYISSIPVGGAKYSVAGCRSG